MLKNPKKYMGVGAAPIYKSRNELIVFSKLDTDDNVHRWGYEILNIPYFNPIDSKIHKYKIDIYCEIKQPAGLLRCLIEIKSREEMKPPKKPTLVNNLSRQRYKYAARTWAVNSAKWKAAIDFCKKSGFKIMFMDEKDIAKL